MRYLLLFAVIYLVIKSLGKMLASMKITDVKEKPLEDQKIETQNRIRVSEDDIEDADFKELD
jgi:hypothetical protein